MKYPIDPDNPLLSSTSPLPQCNDDLMDDFDIHVRLELIKATAPEFASKDISLWKERLNDLFDWVIGMDGVEFTPDGTSSEG